MLIQKANDLGIYVGDDAAVTAANEILRSPELARALGVSGTACRSSFRETDFAAGRPDRDGF